MSKQILLAVWAALTLSTSHARADCSAPVADYTANLQPLARDLQDYQNCVYRSAAKVSCADEFLRVQAGHAKFEAYGSSIRECAGTPASPFEGVKHSFARLDAEIRATETRVRSMLPWDAGDSRLFLWASAVIAFLVAGQTAASLASFVARWLAGRFISVVDK